MRQIKFRGLLQGGTFIYGSYATDGKGYHAILRENPDDSSEMLNTLVIPETVGQFTGLQDNIGVDIYKGDITCEGVVIWHDEEACFCVESNDNLQQLHSIKLKIVLGNIHLNPELIK
jgi:hypothetical protein